MRPDLWRPAHQLAGRYLERAGGSSPDARCCRPRCAGPWMFTWLVGRGHAAAQLVLLQRGGVAGFGRRNSRPRSQRRQPFELKTPATGHSKRIDFGASQTYPHSAAREPIWGRVMPSSWASCSTRASSTTTRFRVSRQGGSGTNPCAGCSTPPSTLRSTRPPARRRRLRGRPLEGQHDPQREFMGTPATGQQVRLTGIDINGLKRQQGRGDMAQQPGPNAAAGCNPAPA